MTVVAWDGTTLAADRRACSNSAHFSVTKIRRLRDGSLVAGAGEPAFIGAMFDWLDRGADPAKFPTDQRDKEDWQPILHVRTDGKVYRYERTPYPFEVEQRYTAMGSGRDYALAAMWLGYTARDAVAAASAHDPACGNGIDTLTLEERHVRTPTQDPRPQLPAEAPVL